METAQALRASVEFDCGGGNVWEDRFDIEGTSVLDAWRLVQNAGYELIESDRLNVAHVWMTVGGEETEYRFERDELYLTEAAFIQVLEEA